MVSAVPASVAGRRAKDQAERGIVFQWHVERAFVDTDRIAQRLSAKIAWLGFGDSESDGQMNATIAISPCLFPKAEQNTVAVRIWAKRGNQDAFLR